MKVLVLSLILSHSLFAQNYEKHTVRSENESMEVLIDSNFDSEEIRLVKYYLNFGASIPNIGKGTPLFKEIFKGSVSGDTYVKWLRPRLKRIRKGELDNALAYVSFIKPSANTNDMFDLFLTSKYFNEYESKANLAQATIFIHEAAHMRLKNFFHDKCNEIEFSEDDKLEAINVKEMNETSNDCANDMNDAYVYDAIFTLNFLKADFIDGREDYFLKGFNSYNRGQRISGHELRERISIDIYGKNYKSIEDSY